MLQVPRMGVSVLRCWASSNCWLKPKERNFPWNPRLFIARHRSMGFPSFTERPGPKDAPRFSFCTDFPHHRGCSSLFRAAFPISITLSARLSGLRSQRLADRKYSRIPSITTRNHEFTSPKLSALALHALHADMDPWVFGMALAHRTGSRLHHPGRCGAQRRSGGELGKRGGPLGDRAANEARFATNLLSLHDPDAPYRERSQRRTVMTRQAEGFVDSIVSSRSLLPTCHDYHDNLTRRMIPHRSRAHWC